MDGMNDLGSEFLLLYNQLDHYLRELTHSDPSEPFWRRLRWACRDNPALRRHRELVLELHELRNAIIHNREFPERLIATPSAQAVAQLREIIAELTAPERVIPRFAREVRVFGPDSRLSDALAYMLERDYSQAAVRDGGQLTLLTAEGVMRWLARQAAGGEIKLAGVTLAQVLPSEPAGAGRVLGRQATLDDARIAFEKPEGKQARVPQALLITEHGHPTEEPLGIITPWDLLEPVDDGSEEDGKEKRKKS